VRPMSDPGKGHWMISNGPGSHPVWSRNGRELFFLTHQPAALMSVSIRGDGPFAAGPPQKVLDWPYWNFYDVSPDGSRFLVVKDGSDPAGGGRSRLLVVMNWFGELKRLAAR